MRLFIVLAWSMQFVLIEWEVYRLTKDPLSLGLIGLMEIIPAISMALFAGHIVDQNEKKGLLIKCFSGLATISALMCLLVHPNFIDSFQKYHFVRNLRFSFRGRNHSCFLIPSVLVYWD